MKKFLLFCAVLLAGLSLFADSGATFAFDVTTAGTIADKGNAVRSRDALNKKGAKIGYALYYDVKSGDWTTITFTLAADQVSFCFRASKGGRYECKSLKINGEEKLTAPIIAERVTKKKPEKFNAKADDGKIVVVAQVRKLE